MLIVTFGKNREQKSTVWPSDRGSISLLFQCVRSQDLLQLTFSLGYIKADNCDKLIVMMLMRAGPMCGHLIYILLSPPQGTRLPTGLSWECHSLSGDLKLLLGPRTLSFPGHHRALQHSSLSTRLQQSRTPGNSKCILRC